MSIDAKKMGTIIQVRSCFLSESTTSFHETAPKMITETAIWANAMRLGVPNVTDKALLSVCIPTDMEHHERQSKRILRLLFASLLGILEKKNQKMPRDPYITAITGKIFLS